MNAGTLKELSIDECRALLRTVAIGRVVFCDVRGPVALPVNFAVDDDDIVFRTTAFSSVLASTYVRQVSFEADAIDSERREGWSVLATGYAIRVQDPADLQHVEMLGVVPWAEGPRDQYLRLRVRSITGRRIVGAPPLDGA